MKNIKKLLSIVMVLALVLSLGATVLADGPATAKVTIDERLKDHTFTAYQIFTGTQNDASGNRLGSVAWGADIDPAKFVAALKVIDETKFGACDAEDVDTVVEAISAAVGVKELSEKIAEAAYASLTGSGKSFTKETELENGYYLIKDTTPADKMNGNDAYNDVVLQVTENVEITYKTSVPTSDKSVQDINDSVDGDVSDNAWEKSADWDIGDAVPFQLKGTLPSNYGDYETYYMAFHDVEEKGLTFNPDSVKVYVDGVQITTDYEVKTPDPDGEAPTLEDGCTFEIVITDLKTAAPDATSSSVITVEYTATLNKDAVIGNPGNHNQSHMEFSNDTHGEGHGNTPDVTVVVFTYDLDVNKVDKDEKPLAGAEFALYKEVPAGADGAAPAGAFHLTKDGEKATDDTKADDLLNEKWYIASPNDLKVDEKDATVFTAEGLDDGNYVIVETKAPDGYNKAAPIEFTLTAAHSETTNVTSPTADQDFSVTLERAEGEAIIDTKVVNQTGLELPETGGIGTTIFYVVGAILVAGAVILLVTRKRMNGADK